MSQHLIALLERASSIATPLYQVDQPLDQLSVIRIWPLNMDGEWLVITRVVPVLMDFTGRPARLSHHVLLPRGISTGAHVQSLLESADIFRDQWNGAPETLPKRAIPQPTSRRLPSIAIRSITTQPESWLRRVANLAQLRGGASNAVAVPLGISRRQVIAEICGYVSTLEKLHLASTAEPFDGHLAALIVISVGDQLSTGMRWVESTQVEPAPSSQPLSPTKLAPPKPRTPAGIDLSGLLTAPSIGNSTSEDESEKGISVESPSTNAFWTRFASIDDQMLVLLIFTMGMITGSAVVLLITELIF